MISQIRLGSRKQDCEATYFETRNESGAKSKGLGTRVRASKHDIRFVSETTLGDFQ